MSKLGPTEHLDTCKTTVGEHHREISLLLSLATPKTRRILFVFALEEPPHFFICLFRHSCFTYASKHVAAFGRCRRALRRGASPLRPPFAEPACRMILGGRCGKPVSQSLGGSSHQGGCGRDTGTPQPQPRIAQRDSLRATLGALIQECPNRAARGHPRFFFVSDE